MKKELRKNFIYPKLNDDNRKYGASIMLAPVLREDGDWRDTFSEDELQTLNGVEQSSCFIQAQQHAIEAVEFVKFGEKNKYDARFNALLSGGTETGGDPVAGADSIRHDGMVPEGLMGYEYSNWSEYHSWRGADETHCRGVGNADIYLKDRRFGVVITREMPLATKYQVLREALKRSPVPISLYGVPDGQGSYIPKPKGVGDTHLVAGLILHISDNNKITIKDTYTPFLKKLPPNYNMDFGCVWTVEKKLTLPQKKSLWQLLVSFLFGEPKELEKLAPDLNPDYISPPEPKIAVPPYVPSAVVKPKYDWSFPSKVKHSVRVICDEEGLTLEQKNTLCATIQCESNFNTKAVNKNYITLSNGTKVLASTDFGICQWNDYWHGKEITPDEAVNNPEKAVRLMCAYWKRGQRKLWVCYSKGMYKKYL